MNEAQADEAITQHWSAGWEALHGAGPTFVPWVPLNQITDSTPEYVRLSIVSMTRRQATTGDTKRWRHTGELAVQIFTRANIGTRRAKELAGDVRTVLEGRFITAPGDDEPVTTLAGPSRSPQTDGVWFMMLVTVPYSFDELRLST